MIPPNFNKTLVTTTTTPHLTPNLAYACSSGCPDHIHFTNLSDWALHETTEHRKVWSCRCGEIFQQFENARAHWVEMRHGPWERGHRLPRVIAVGDERGEIEAVEKEAEAEFQGMTGEKDRQVEREKEDKLAAHETGNFHVNTLYKQLTASNREPWIPPTLAYACLYSCPGQTAHFTNLTDWSEHHAFFHGIAWWCGTCNKRFDQFHEIRRHWTLTRHVARQAGGKMPKLVVVKEGEEQKRMMEEEALRLAREWHEEEWRLARVVDKAQAIRDGKRIARMLPSLDSDDEETDEGKVDSMVRDPRKVVEVVHKVMPDMDLTLYGEAALKAKRKEADEKAQKLMELRALAKEYREKAEKAEQRGLSLFAEKMKLKTNETTQEIIELESTVKRKIYVPPLIGK